jgi:hypothetical protein
MYEVKDGSRILRFDGELLGESTSFRRGSDRWIEFELYKTLNGSYVLSRVGVSLVYHTASCPLVRRYGLVEAAPKALRKDALPCEECEPSRELPMVFPEKNRTWAQVSEDPEAVLEALYKYDNNNTRYLTKVAQRLLEQASERDERIEAVYRIETIP